MTVYEGLVDGLDEVVYHGLPGLSSTGAKKLLKSPAHYQHYIQNPGVTKDEFDLGAAVHAKVLGVGAAIDVYPDEVLASNGAISTKAAKEFAEAARAEGRIPVKRVVANVVNRMAESVLGDPTARKLLSNGMPEVSMFATDPDTNVALRGRADYLGARMVDLKTTAGDASEAEFAISAFRLGYEIQAAHYEWIHHLITDETLPYLFIVVENTAPFLTAVHRLGDDELRMGRERARHARERFAQCRDANYWGGYTNRDGGPIGILRAPVWNVNQYIDQFEGKTP